ncbi:hypothetical protein B0H11DRAFT_2209000 [Mycena galericulata]|nr:hypothetical protein B0H11DRAFT_2209000 [Mycena galericulata]
MSTVAPLSSLQASRHGRDFGVFHKPKIRPLFTTLTQKASPSYQSLSGIYVDPLKKRRSWHYKGTTTNTDPRLPELVIEDAWDAYDALRKAGKAKPMFFANDRGTTFTDIESFAAALECDVGLFDQSYADSEGEKDDSDTDPVVLKRKEIRNRKTAEAVKLVLDHTPLWKDRHLVRNWTPSEEGAHLMSIQTKARIDTEGEGMKELSKDNKPGSTAFRPPLGIAVARVPLPRILYTICLAVCGSARVCVDENKGIKHPQRPSNPRDTEKARSRQHDVYEHLRVTLSHWSHQFQNVEWA